MGSLRCEEVRSATFGCEVVVLAATEPEADLLLQSLEATRTVLIAGKKVVVGERARIRPGSSRQLALAVTGIDKVNTAHMLTCLLQAMDPAPRVVLQTGIAGAFAERQEFAGPAVGDIVIATREAYADTGSSSPDGWLSARELGWPLALAGGVESNGVFPVDGRLVAAALEVLASAAARAELSALSAIRPEQRLRVLAGPCVTVSTVTGRDVEALELIERWDAVAESMEGAAAAHVCALYDVPFLEVRGISNLVGDRDRGSWEVPRAVAAASWATGAILDDLESLPLPRVGPRLTGEW